MPKYQKSQQEQSRHLKRNWIQGPQKLWKFFSFFLSAAPICSEISFCEIVVALSSSRVFKVSALKQTECFGKI